MKFLITMFGILFLLAALAAGLYGCYLAAGYLWSLYMDLEATIRLILLSSMATVLLASLLVAAALKKALLHGQKDRLAPARLELYKTLLRSCRDTIPAAGGASTQPRTDVLSRLNELESEITLLGSAAVIESHRKLIAALGESDTDQLARLSAQLIKAMRRDLGQASSYDESRMKFIFAHETSARPQPPGQGVNI